MTDFSKAIELQPEDGDNFFWRARIYLETGDTIAACNDLNKACELQPDDSVNLLWRGVAQRLLGDEEAAQSDWQRAAELLQTEEQDDHWHTKAARLALLQGDPKTARVHYTQALQTYTNLADMRTQVEHLQRLARLFPEHTAIRELCDWLAAQLPEG